MHRVRGEMNDRSGRRKRARGVLPAIAALALALVLRPALAQRGAGWDPGRTWVFAVGVLEWKDSDSFGSFPQKNRRDAQFIRLLRERGVPAEQIVYLKDQAATTRAIQAAFRSLLAKTA